MTLEADDLDVPKDAANLVENPGLAVQITNSIGKPIEYGLIQLLSFPITSSDDFANLSFNKCLPNPNIS